MHVADTPSVVSESQTALFGPRTKNEHMRRPWLSILGAVLLVLGVGNLVVNMQYETTVFTPSGSVHNIGKMDQRREWNANCRILILIGFAMIGADFMLKRNARN